MQVVGRPRAARAAIQGLPLAVDAFGWPGAVTLLAIGPVAGAVAMALLRRAGRADPSPAGRHSPA